MHESNGNKFKLNNAVIEITKDSVKLSDGSSLDADMVLLGVGIGPNTVNI